ncbi:MAG: AIG2-like domain protein, partial [uncultured Corynebacteriales bacterium]
GSVRGLRVQHGSGADDPARPALAGRRHGVDHRLVAHLRRGGPRLGGGAGHAGGVAGRARVRRALRRHPVRRGAPGLLGGRRHRALPQDPAAGAHPGPRRPGLGVRAGRLRGRAAVGALPRGAGRRGRAGRGAGRLRHPAADAALPQVLAL